MKELKKRINLLFWPEKGGRDLLLPGRSSKFFDEAILPKRGHYIDYLSLEFLNDRADIFANILAILFGITEKPRRDKILKYFHTEKISLPYPVRVLNPAIIYPDQIWDKKIDSYRKDQQKSLPFCYHNGAVWPYVGGFYVLMLAKAGKMNKAKKELVKLAQANKLGV